MDEAIDTASARVLVVDDNPIYAMTLPCLLHEHDVTVVMSGTEALELLRAGRTFDVVLCDLMMPVMTGMELHATLSLEFPSILPRLVFITGGASTGGARAFLDSVPNRRLEKPVPPDELRALVAECVRAT